MANVHEQNKEGRFIITFELPKGEGYEEAIREIGIEKQYTTIFGKAEESPHQIARRLFIDFLNERKNVFNRSQEVSIPV